MGLPAVFRTIACTLLLAAFFGCATEPTPQAASVRLHFAFKQAQPANDSLYPIYPNPFNRVLGDTGIAIQFTLRDSGSVALVIQNALGNQIALFSDSALAPGSYSGWWEPFATDGTTLTSGIYFITLNNGDFIDSRLVDIQENE